MPPDQVRWSLRRISKLALLGLPIPITSAQQQHGNANNGDVAHGARIPSNTDVPTIATSAGDPHRKPVLREHPQVVHKPAADDATIDSQEESQPQKKRARDSTNDNHRGRDPSLHDPKPNPEIHQYDASALATLAPDQSVRAPHPPRHLQPRSSKIASGLASQQIARSLEDWEVEDFVLLATVDGDLYATDRNTGEKRWHLEVEQPMIETKLFRVNNSVLDPDYLPVDHYIWAIEPTRDGGVYVYIPDSDAGLVRTGFTMKSLVDLAPYSNDDPPVVYNGDKKTTLITLDAATGRVLKWFGSGGAHVNDRESCVPSNKLYDSDREECSSSTGTITLGRTEYTVGIQRKSDGEPLATLKYSEWGPNHFDSDLYQQYDKSLDGRYVTSQHDGQVYAFDPKRASAKEALHPVFKKDFSSPAARVFDVCRPWDAPSDSNPELVVLPQPPMPQKAEFAEAQNNRIFLNQTSTGGWYALSGRAYPLIINAPNALMYDPRFRDLQPAWETISDDRFIKALVGNHYLESMRGDSIHDRVKQPLTLPPNTILPGPEDSENESHPSPGISPADGSPTFIGKVKRLPHIAANNVKDFFSNPVLLIVLVFFVAYNHQKFRRAYHRFLATRSIVAALLYLISSLNGVEYRGNDEKLSESGSDPVGSDGEAALQKVAVLRGEIEKETTLEKESSVEEEVQQAQGTSPESISIEKEDSLQEEAQEDRVAPEEKKVVHVPVDKPAETNDTEAKEATPTPVIETIASPEKKKAHRGRRGGVKHKKKGAARQTSQSRDDDPAPTTVDDAVMNAKKLGDRPRLEPDVMTVNTDMSAVTEPIYRMGNIEVNMDEQLGTGSNGTLVFAGKFDGREVAVKRMLIQFYEFAVRETELLRESDDHPNVIRYYSQQARDGFLYIALEKCAASLADVIEKPHMFRQLADAGKQNLPSVLYQITNGIRHLHNLRIVHRDLKPQNILVNLSKDGRPRLLVSDFGLCKKLEGGQSSFGATTGRAAGTTGWRAPELLLDDDAREAGVTEMSIQSGSGTVLVNDGLVPGNNRGTRAIDIFSLGLVFFYVLTNGSHPFDCGDRYMREVNIRKGNYKLDQLDVLGDFAYEARDLIHSMLAPNYKDRPHAEDVMSHPFFWPAKKRLAFLCDVSDHFEKEPRDPPSPALQELERHAPDVINNGDFLKGLGKEFVDSLGKQRKYTGNRLLDLLRALRNKRNHYEDMPDSLKRAVGSLPEGYLAYWTIRFPMLLLTCWNVVYECRWENTDRFKEYYQPKNGQDD